MRKTNSSNNRGFCSHPLLLGIGMLAGVFVNTQAMTASPNKISFHRVDVITDHSYQQGEVIDIPFRVVSTK